MAYEFAFIFLAAPALVWACAQAAPGPRLGAVFRILGAASYAVYVLHYPLVELTRRALHVLGREPADFAPWLGAAFLAAVLTSALVLDSFYDLRVRRFLTARLSRSRTPQR